MRVLVVFLFLVQTGCTLHSNILSLMGTQQTPIQFTEDSPIFNSDIIGSVPLSGVCAKDVDSFTILKPEPAKVVECKNGTWSTTLDLSTSPEGVVDLETDQVDPISGKNITFEVVKDTTPPVLSSLILESNATLTNKSVISYQAVGSDLAEVYVTQDATCATGGAWKSIVNSVTVSAGDGLKSFYVKGKDSVGNISTCAFGDSITLDQTAPVVTGLTNDGITKPSKSWSWSCTDVHAPCEYRYQVALTSALAPSGVYGLTQTTNQSGDGVYFISVQARDAAGNESTVVSVQATLSSALPTLTIENGATYHNSNVVQLYLDNYAAFDEVDVSNSAACASATTEPVAATLGWSLLAGEGLKTVYYRYRNTTSGDVTACASATITVDSQAPSLVLTSAAADPFKTATFAVTATFSESVTGFALSDISVTNGVASGLTGSGASYSFTVTPSGQGLVTVAVPSAVAVDVAGNSNTAATSLTRVYDSVLPSVVLSSAVTDPFNAASFVVTATFSESVTGLVSGDFYLDNAVASSFSGSGTTYTFTVTPITDGVVTVELPPGVAVDAAGNGNIFSNSLTPTYDATAPTITGLLSENTWYKSKTWNWACDEACTYRFVVDMISNTSPSGAFSATDTVTQSSGTGTYYLHVEARDAAGNSSSEHVYVWMDNTAPTVPSNVVDQVRLASLTASPVITYTSGTDAHSGLAATHQMRVLKASDSSLVYDWNFRFSGTAITGLSLTTNTSYIVQVRAVDAVGNVSAAVSSDGWIADTSAPAAPTGLTLGSVPSSVTTTPTLSWTAASDGAGGSGVQFYEAKVFRTSDNADISAWVTLSSGAAIGSLTLVDGVQYYFKVRATDAAGNLGSESAASSSWTAVADACLGSPSPGAVCAGGTIFLGTRSPGATSGSGTNKYMTTPGGCGDIPGNAGPATFSTSDFTPTCTGGADTLNKYWNDGTTGWVDIPGITNYTTNEGTGFGATNTDANYGSTNTTNAAGNMVVQAAARYCDKLSYAGHTDWYLPNRYELNLLYINKASIPGVDDGIGYWSSSEYNNMNGWIQYTSDGLQNSNNKNVAVHVRCVRRY